jgi:hypothetical protein
LVMPVKHVLSVMGLQNHPGNPKLWTIAHETAQKRKKQCVFGHTSQTFSECHGPCKSPRKPKTVGNSS